MLNFKIHDDFVTHFPSIRSSLSPYKIIAHRTEQ